MRIIIIILTMMLVMPAAGQRRKKGDGDIAHPYIEGIAYALPRTGVKISIKAVKETFIPGPYSSYAAQLLGINDAKERMSEKWFIDDVRLTTFSEPDPDHIYKALGESAFSVSLTSDGCLAGINSKNLSISDKAVIPNVFIQKPELNDGFSFADFNDSPMYISGDSTTNYRPLRVGPETKAAEAAARVLECRQAKFHMASGLLDEMPPDGAAYRISLDELERMEKDFLSLFTGRVTHSTKVFSFDFIPSVQALKGEVVFRFSEEKGVLPASDLSGKPVMLKVEIEKDLLSKYSGQTKSENPLAGESGVYYKMPAIADISLIYEINTILTARIVLPQFGAVAPVPEELLFGDYSVEIHPGTGAIKSVIKD